MQDLGLATKCLRAGYTPKNGEPIALPIVQSTTYKYESSDAMGALFDLEADGYFYTRLANPTNDAVAAKIAALEGGVAGVLTSSGQAANLFAVLNLCSAGDHVVASTAIYGGTFNLFNVTLRRFGIDFTFVSPDCDEETLEAAFCANTKAVFGETLSNPSLNVFDIERFAVAAHRHGVPLIVDNTFPTPVNCRPFEFGADIVMNPSKEDAVAKIKEMTGGYGCDIYIEASGHPSSVQQGLDCIRKMGRFVEFSVFGAPVTVDWSIISDRKELDLLGVHLSPYCYDTVIEWIANGKLPTDGVVTNKFSLDDWEEGFHIAKTGENGALKVVLIP